MKMKENTEMGKNEIVLFESRDGAVSLPVSVESDTVWLSQAQMAQLFGKDRTVIGRHIRNAISDGEIDVTTMCAKFAHMGKDADQTYWTEAYNLDVIISVGYRVKSQRGVEFRRWATSVLKEYLVQGYAVNRDRIRQLGQTIEVMKRVANSLDTEQVLDVVQTYSAALDLLDGYDHQTIEKPVVSPVRKPLPRCWRAEPIHHSATTSLHAGRRRSSRGRGCCGAGDRRRAPAMRQRFSGRRSRLRRFGRRDT